MPELIRDGVRLAYDEAGSGGPPMLFVHGFAGRAEHFAPQMEHFRRTHRVVAVDRRGHGRSDKPEGPYAIPAIADEIAWTVRELGLDRPVLVFHSMGSIGLDLASRAPELLSALILIDTPLFAPAVKHAFAELLEGLRSPAYRDVIAAACDRMIFLPTDDKARRARLHAGLLELPQSLLVATWKEIVAYDEAPAAARVTRPLLAMNSVMPCDEARLRALIPHAAVGRTVGAGHFPQLEVPAQVNAMIEQFLAVTAAAR